METLAHSTLGWIAMQRKSWDAVEGELQKSLALYPNKAEVHYFMGTVIASEKNPQRMPVAIFYFTRAATNDGTEALPAAGRQQVLGAGGGASYAASVSSHPDGGRNRGSATKEARGGGCPRPSAKALEKH
jgi:hypothetical protein